MTRRTLWIAIAAALSLLAADRPRETKLQQAMDLMESKGDLPGAIKLLEDVAKSPDRNLAARGLLYLGDCREKLGQKESRASYERIVREFADQKEVAAEANRRLAGLAGASGPGKITTERVTDLDWETFNLASDRPLYTATDWVTGDLILHDLATGEARNLTRNGPAQKGKGYAQTSLISVDGEMVVYGVDGGGGGSKWSEIRSIHIDGSGLRTHLRRMDNSEYLSPVALSPDKKIAIVTVGNLVEILSLADNSLKPVGDDLRLGFPEGCFSPDGKQVVLSGTVRNEDQGLFLAGANGGVRPLLAEKAGAPLWSPDGRWIVFISDRTGPKAIWAIPASGGTPRLLKEEQGVSRLHGFARDGSLYYSTVVNQSDIYVAQLDPATFALKGEPSQFINTFLGRNRLLSFSPDGRWAVWLSARRKGEMQSAILRPAAGGDEKEMPWITAVGGGRPRIWLPDSKAVLNRRTENAQVIFERVEVVDGRATELYHGPAPQFTPIAVMPNDNAVLGYRCYGPSSKACDLLRMEAKAVTVAETLSDFAQIRDISLSPDGKWLAIWGKLSSAPGFPLFVRPTAGGKLVELYRGSETEGIQMQNGIVWAPDSTHVICGITAAEHGIWGAREFRAIPVGGGAPKVIPLKGTSPALAADGRFTYTVASRRNELWAAHNLLPTN